jgi:pimeloyl-ACP methyl ester carboxylesterase
VATFYGFNRPGAQLAEAVLENWWRQGMMGGAKAHFDAIVAFSQTDFTENLKQISVPVLVMHGVDDPIVPYAGFPHGMPTTQAETINADLLAFSKRTSAWEGPSSRAERPDHADRGVARTGPGRCTTAVL